MSEVPEFEKFEKIARLNRDIIITEKIDGTNAQIYIEENKAIWVGSRNRWIEPGKESDNHGFAGWVRENWDSLLNLGPGRHYGEWWGQGIQRRYGLEEKRFSLFNVSRWSSENNVNYIKAKECPPDCCDVVPILYSGPFSTGHVDDCLYTLRDMGSFAAPGFMDPEGIVIWHEAVRKCFKVTIKNDEKPKGETK